MISLLRRHWRTVTMVLGVLGLALAAWSQHEAIATLSIAPLPFAGAVALLAVAPLLQAVSWLVALRSLGAPAPAGGALRLWARSFLLRYEPSGAVGFAHRVMAREQAGATSAQILTATGYEQLGAVAAGALVAVCGFAAAGAGVPWLAVATCAGTIALLVALRPAFLGRWIAGALDARGVRVAGLLHGRVLVALVALNLTGWAFTGLGVRALAAALGIGGSPWLLVGVFALSWLLGVLVPLAPGGLGLRDGIFVLWLGASVGAGAATGLALVLRLATFAGELVAVAALELLARRFPVTAGPPASAPVAAADPRGTIVVVPTYEEAEALPLFVERFAATGMELLIVDDSSPDGTGELAERLAADRPWMHVLHRVDKDGLGRAYRAGFGWCLQRGYRVVGQMDCDLSHPPEKLTEMLGVLEDRHADLVIGNRYMDGGGTDGWSTTRRLLSKAGCTGSRLVLGLPYGDLSGGFKLWRASCLSAMDFDAMLADGYAFQVETTQLAYLMGKRIEEVPFVFSERVAGASKMTLAISLEGIRVTLALRRRTTKTSSLVAS